MNSPTKSEIKEALRKISQHGEEMIDRCEMAIGTKNIAERALSGKE